MAGFYRHDQNKLYVVSKTGAPGANERITFAHEYDHALQDQHSTVFTDQDGILDQTDRILARQAVYEGDATLLMTLWAAANLSLADLAELLGVGQRPGGSRRCSTRMPAILRETLLFPYTTGCHVRPDGADRRAAGRPSTRIYDRMPESTEQILHPETYAANEQPVDGRPAGRPRRPARDRLDRAARGHVRRVPARDLAARERASRPAAATTATTGWGGDRLAVVDGPDGAWGVVLETDLGHARPTPTSSRTPRRPRSTACPTRPGSAAPAGKTRHDPDRLGRRDAARARRHLRRDRASDGPRRADRAYIDSGAEIPSSPSALASVIRAAPARASRAADRSGASGSTTRASR